MMDRDYPPTPLQVRLTAIALGVSAVVGLLWFGGFLPGLRPDYHPSPYVTYDGRTYYAEYVEVPIPWFSAHSAPAASSFHNVTFETWVTNWSVFGGTYYHGNATEPNGTVYAFALGGLRSDANWTEAYLAPGGAVAVGYDGGLTAEFLVLVL